MSRQIQIRRGTATEHENFVGAIGEITMDTTNKTLRLHDGETAGGIMLAKHSNLPVDSADYVVESQIPNANNNYTWYRKYKSGWIEQGGVKTVATPSTSFDIVFPIKMQNVEYTLHATAKSPASTSASTPHGYHYIQKTNTGCKIIVLRGDGGDWLATEINWQIAGLQY